MKYQVYYKNDKVDVYNGDNAYILNMVFINTSCPVNTGGKISLPNGDILHINEKYGPLDPWETGTPEYEGIGLSLESGHAFIAYLIIPSNIGSWPQTQETGYGVFYDLDGLEYEDGNILKIYDLEVDDLYDLVPEEMYWQESRYLNYGLSCTGVIIINGDNWELTTDSKYVGKTLTMYSGEDVYISGPSMEDGIGIYFTLSSGASCVAFYLRNRNVLAESSNYWFSTMIPEEGDEIHIYTFDDGLDYSILEDNYTESAADEYTYHTYYLKVINGEWEIRPS